MGSSVVLGCKVCGIKATVDMAALKSLAILDSQLPLGWTVRTEQDPASGRSDMVTYCPNHNPEP